MAKLTSNTTGNFRTYGIRTAETRRSHTGLYRVVAILLFLIVCGAVVWGVKRHLDSRGAIPSGTVKPVPDNDAAALTFADERAIADDPETTEAIREYRARENDTSASPFDIQEFERQRLKQQRKLYDEALQAFNERKFEKCRTILRDMLAPMDSSDSMYDPAANLLGRASMNIFRSGSDSETNLDYVVKSGDNLSMIAYRHHVKLADLIAANKVDPKATLRIGQTLVIPAAGAKAASSTMKPATTTKTDSGTKPATTTKPATATTTKTEPATTTKPATTTPSATTTKGGEGSGGIVEPIGGGSMGGTSSTSTPAATTKPAAGSATSGLASVSALDDADIFAVPIDSESTLEEVANIHDKNLEDLIRLNPEFKPGQKIPAGTAIKMPLF